MDVVNGAGVRGPRPLDSTGLLSTENSVPRWTYGPTCDESYTASSGIFS